MKQELSASELLASARQLFKRVENAQEAQTDKALKSMYIDAANSVYDTIYTLLQVIKKTEIQDYTVEDWEKLDETLEGIEKTETQAS